jgi:uncharacterized protein (TIGR02996 family)
MNREDAFLQSILANSDDDTPRLVYADWLDDNGRPERAEFIRVQIELARLAEDDPRREGLEERERALLNARQEDWLGAAGRLLSTPEFRRGFVERGQLGARQFLTHAEELFRLAPIRHLKLLRLPQMKEGPKELAACPHLASLRGLDLDYSLLGDRKLEQILSSRHLHGLTTLSLRGTETGTRVLRLLASGAFRNLRALTLFGNALGSCLGTLTEEDAAFELEELNLGDCGLDSDNVRRLAAWPGLASLTSLCLRNNGLRVISGEHLAASPHLTRLTHLDLCGTGIGVRGIRALAAAPGLAGLRRLEMSGDAIGVNGLRAVLDSPNLQGLTSLNLGNNNLSDAGLALLGGWAGLARVRVLGLASNSVTDGGVKSLTSSPDLGSLIELNLSSNTFVGDESARSLAACSGLKRLRVLNLSANYTLTDDGVKALVESPHLDGLRELAVEGVLMRPGTQKRLETRFPPRT